MYQLQTPGPPIIQSTKRSNKSLQYTECKVDFKLGLFTRMFLENLSNSVLGFRRAMKIWHSWWRIRRAPRLFATHWAGLMISAWPGFVYLNSVHIAFCSRAPGGQPDGHRASFHRAPLVLHLCSVLYARLSTSPFLFLGNCEWKRDYYLWGDGNYARLLRAASMSKSKMTWKCERAGALVPLCINHRYEAWPNIWHS